MTDPAGSEGYYTLTEVSKHTGISMPTLQKYKKNHQDRIPSVGKGRKQRYPKSAFAVFEELKQEALSRRGRKKSKSKRKARGKVRASKKAKRGKKKSASRRRKDDGMLSLMQIKEQTGISYPTLLRYTRLHLDKIPHDDSGSRRRFPPEAVDVFRELRQQSTRGRKPARPDKLKTSGRRTQARGGASSSAVERRLEKLESSQRALQEELRSLVEVLGKPMTITVQRNR